MIVDKILSLKINFVHSFGYALLFLATFLESAPFFGLFVPGSIIIFIAAFIAKLGFLNFKIVVAVAILGAIFGDLFGYLTGRYFGKNFLMRYGRFLLIKKEYLQKTGEIIEKHSGKSLVLGRLNPLTRAAIPFVAGCHKMNSIKFMFFNIIGGVLWGALFSFLGYFLGQSYQFAEKFEKVIIIATILLIMIVYDYYLTKNVIENKKRKAFIEKGEIGELIEKWA